MIFRYLFRIKKPHTPGENSQQSSKIEDWINDVCYRIIQFKTLYHKETTKKELNQSIDKQMPRVYIGIYIGNSKSNEGQDASLWIEMGSGG